MTLIKPRRRIKRRQRWGHGNDGQLWTVEARKDSNSMSVGLRMSGVRQIALILERNVYSTHQTLALM